METLEYCQKSCRTTESLQNVEETRATHMQHLARVTLRQHLVSNALQSWEDCTGKAFSRKAKERDASIIVAVLPVTLVFIKSDDVAFLSSLGMHLFCQQHQNKQ